MIKLNSQYQKMLNDPKTDKESVKFLKDKLEAAKDFLEHIEKRNETIEKIVSRVISAQNGFFENGEIRLNPLMQKDIANELGLHPSTISRAIANKYVQTPRGVFSLKFLCPRDVKGLTSDRIEKMIEGIIMNEDKKAPAKRRSDRGKNGIGGPHPETPHCGGIQKKTGLPDRLKKSEILARLSR